MSITIEISEVWLDGGVVVKTVEVDGTLHEAIGQAAAAVEGQEEMAERGSFVAVVHAGEDIQVIVTATGPTSIYDSAGVDFLDERYEAMTALVKSGMTLASAADSVDALVLKHGKGFSK